MISVSVYWPLSILCVLVCVCVCVYVISNQSTSKRPHYMSDFSKPDALLDKTHIKVLLKALSYQGLTSVDPSKIAHQMWHDHPFCQRNKTTEIACGCEGWRWQGRRDLKKKGGRQCREWVSEFILPSQKII